MKIFGSIFKMQCKKLLNKSLKERVFRYLLVGLFLNILGYSLYIGLTQLGFNPVSAMSSTYAIFLYLSFYMHKNFTFIESTPSPSKSIFLMIHASAYILNLSLLYFFVYFFGFPHYLVQAIAIGVVAVYLYLLLNFTVFKERK